MSEIQVASRYAKSLIDLAQEENSLETIKSDIELFVQVCRENPVLAALLKNPIVSPSKKIAILDELFGNKMSKMVLSFFKIVTSKMRSSILLAIGKEFINEYNRRKGIIKATVVSAAPLSEANRAAVIAKVKETVSGEIVLDARVDPDLIGGFILQVGDKQFDTSISSNLNKLSKEFAQKTIN